MKNYDEFGEDPDFAEIASALADNLVETEREAVTEFAAQVVKAEDADEGDDDANDEVQDYRTFNWTKNIKYPELTFNKSQQFLSDFNLGINQLPSLLK